MNWNALVAALLAVLIIPASASANPEPTAYDTRSVTLGLTGVSYLERPAAIAMNPALLEGIDKFSVSFMFNPLFVNQEAPVMGSNPSVAAPPANPGESATFAANPGAQLKSGIGFGPIGAFFIAGRVAPRVVFGGGVYLEVAYGSDFADVSNVDGPSVVPAGVDSSIAGAGNGPDGDNSDFPDAQDLKVIFVVGEVAFGPSFRLSDKVNLGFAIRIPFAIQQATLFQNAGAALQQVNYSNIRNELSGVGWPSARIGISWKPIEQLSLGFAYRPFAKIPLKGTTMVTNGRAPLDDLNTDASAEWRVPHMIQFGGALRLVDKKLMLVLEERIQFHDATRTGNRDQTVTVDLAGIPASLVVPFGWRNVFSTKLGIEYKISDLIDIRGGANASISATTDPFAQYFTPPPGLNWFVSYGLGFNWEKFAFDVGGAVAWGGKTLDKSVSRNPDGTPRQVDFDGEVFGLCTNDQATRTGCAGDYKVITYWISLNFVYKVPDPGARTRKRRH